MKKVVEKFAAYIGNADDADWADESGFIFDKSERIITDEKRILWLNPKNFCGFYPQKNLS